MKKEEAIKIFSLLAAAFPKIEIPEDTIALWEGALLPLQARSGMKAVRKYLLSPGKKFFPTPGEIIEIYDRLELIHREQEKREHRQSEQEATGRLFHDPHTSFADNYARRSVQLIRDVCGGVVKYNSPKWKERFEAIHGEVLEM